MTYPSDAQQAERATREIPDYPATPLARDWYDNREEYEVEDETE